MGQPLLHCFFVGDPEGIELVPLGRQGQALGMRESCSQCSLHNLTSLQS